MSRERQTLVVEPQQERAQQKRNALLESGRALFASRGYDQVTAKDIAAHAGVAVGTFYRYFSDKKQLLMNLVEDRLTDFLAPEIPLHRAGLPQMVTELLQRHFERVRELGLSQALEGLIFRDPEVAEWAASARKRAHQKLQEHLQKIKELGLTRPDLDPDMAAWAILAMVQGSRSEERFLAEPGAVGRLAQLITRMLFPDVHA